MSLGWFGAGPGDGTGQMADEITAFVARDRRALFDLGRERTTVALAGSPLVDGDGNDWVDFAPGDDLNELSAPPCPKAIGSRSTSSGTTGRSPTTDYSLHLFNLDGAEPVEVAVSDRPQTGQSWQTPYEQISYTAPDGGRFGVRIGRAGVVGTNDSSFSAWTAISSTVSARDRSRFPATSTTWSRSPRSTTTLPTGIAVSARPDRPTVPGGRLPAV